MSQGRESALLAFILSRSLKAFTAAKLLLNGLLVSWFYESPVLNSEMTGSGMLTAELAKSLLERPLSVWMLRFALALLPPKCCYYCWNSRKKAGVLDIE